MEMIFDLFFAILTSSGSFSPPSNCRAFLWTNLVQFNLIVLWYNVCCCVVNGRSNASNECHNNHKISIFEIRSIESIKIKWKKT